MAGAIWPRCKSTWPRMSWWAGHGILARIARQREDAARVGDLGQRVDQEGAQRPQ